MAADPKAEITEKVNVTRQEIVVAKAFLWRCFDQNPSLTDTSRAIELFLEDVHAVALKTSQPSGQDAWFPLLSQIADAISWRIAAHEALWELVHCNELVASQSFTLWYPNVQYDTPHEKGGWLLPGFQIDIPAKVYRPHSKRSAGSQILLDGDLFLERLEIPDLSDSVSMALKETVACFRSELFTAAVVMLGKASEEAWIETGIALCDALPGDNSKIVDKLTGLSGVATKVGEVRKLYEGARPIIDKSVVSLVEFRHAIEWSDLVRESRNVVHFGFDASTPNTYEKVAVLLLGVPRVFRALFAIRRASIAQASQPSP